MNEKPMAVHEVVNLTGITARTLHYYDEIGLLKPSDTTESGYRMYSNKDLETLQQILFLFNFILRYLLISYIRGTASRTPPGDRPEPPSPTSVSLPPKN